MYISNTFELNVYEFNSIFHYIIINLLQSILDRSNGSHVWIVISFGRHSIESIYKMLSIIMSFVRVLLINVNRRKESI